MTLIEIMVGMTLMTVAVVAFLGAFGSIQKSIQYSKAHSLAENLAQEKMQILKQMSYYRILVTTTTLYKTEFDPQIAYDSGYFPPENILEGSISFQRLTFIEVVQEDSGELSYLPSTTDDTGMKLITISVTWNQGSEKKKLQLRSVASNPDTVMSNSIFSGSVTISGTATPIANALVNIAENVGWRDTSNSAGFYSISLVPGSYFLNASAQGYFSQSVQVNALANTATSRSFSLVAMGSGTVKGNVWMSPGLVVSQVVGSSMNLQGFYQEWVEVFNPTSSTWVMATSATDEVIGIAIKPTGQAQREVQLVYSSFTVSPGRYFLFANTTPITAAGISVAADAVYDAVDQDGDADFDSNDLNLITINTDAGDNATGLSVGYAATDAPIDTVGWETGGLNPNWYEGNPIDQDIGLEEEEQYVRKASHSGASYTYARAYDSGDNNDDFVTVNPLTYPPKNTSSTQTIVAGVPAVGAIVSAADELSSPTVATLTGDPAYAQFTLVSVATGAITLVISSGTFSKTIDNVTVTANVSTSIPNGSTSPAWPGIGYNSVLMSTTNPQGYISGRVTNAGVVALSGITVSAGTSNDLTDPNGFFIIPITTGIYTVTANPNNLSPTYVSQDLTDIEVDMGEITSGLDFVLSQGGQINGFITRDGSNALPGIAVAALDANEVSRAQGISGSNGRYTLINLSTGVYFVTPALDDGETATPSTTTITISSAGANMTSPTFTISGAFGSINGSVQAASTSIKTGVMIVASTASMTAPPDLSTNTLSGRSYYTTSSLEDGTYSVEVRGSTTTYFVYAYYTTLTSSGGVVFYSSSTSNKTVTAGSPLTGVNFSWP